MGGITILKTSCTQGTTGRPSVPDVLQLGREITGAAKMGAPDPAMKPRCRLGRFPECQGAVDARDKHSAAVNKARAVQRKL